MSVWSSAGKQKFTPILDGKVDSSCWSATSRDANTQNGHDNVTVGLVYCQVNSFEPESTEPPLLL